MGKARRPERNTRGRSNITTLTETEVERQPRVRRKPPLEPMTENQARYIDSIHRNRITFGLGDAGVGKTYLGARIASEWLDSNRIRKVILTRPAVEVGRPIGFLPGELEKMAPYIASFHRGFNDGLGSGAFDYHLRYKNIEVVPLGFMQGLSWDDPCLVLFDEAENATPAEMKMFLTRMGRGATVVISGDPTQKMIEGQSGLIDAIEKLRYVKSIETVSFTRDDIVRDGIVREILDAYHDAEQPGQHDSAAGHLPAFLLRGADD